jgi:uncharacterized membrane protein YgdD (TMEM256/DUF423 family)
MRPLLLIACITGLTSIGLGAFGSHGLSAWAAALPDGAERLRWWHTAVDYHKLHAVFLFALGQWATSDPQHARRRQAFWAVLVGVAIFSGTLYLMTLTGVRWLGAVTPIGGLSLMVGWGLAGLAALRAAR